MNATELMCAVLAAAEADFPPETANLYGADAILETPFALNSAPLRGDEIASAFAAAHGRRPFSIHIENVLLHETADAHTVVAEVTTRWTLTTSGRQFLTRDVRIIEEKGGLIAVARDYHDHALVARELAA